MKDELSLEDPGERGFCSTGGRAPAHWVETGPTEVGFVCMLVVGEWGRDPCAWTEVGSKSLVGSAAWERFVVDCDV